MKALGIVVLACVISSLNGYKILTLLYLANGSMRNFFDPILLELAKKNNSVTVVASTPGNVEHENIKELQALDIKNMLKGLPNPDFINMRLSKKAFSVWSLKDKWVRDCHEFYKTPVVQGLLKRDETFDLIFLNSYMNECTYGLAHYLNASTIIISPFPVQPWLAEVTGTPSPLSFVGTIYHLPEQEPMGLLERIQSFYKYAYNKWMKNVHYIPAIEEAYRTYVPGAPGVFEIERNVSLVMGSGHFSFTPLRPTMPGVVDELAGLHCREAKPLPNDISRLITKDGKESDFVYFSFGSIVQGHTLPIEYRRAFFNAFSKLNITVLWKYELEYNETEPLPPNVHVKKWFPQQDVLGHPNCKVFITHGGISSVTEAIYHGVPVIGIPFFTDQDWNLKQAERIGVGVMLELEHVTEDKLYTLLQQFLYSERYQETADLRSELFRDRPLGVVKNAVWWVEHVLRHGGAMHLRSPARELNFFQYYSIDILLLFIFSIGVIAFAFYHACKFLLCVKWKSGVTNQKKPKRSKKAN